MRLTSKSTIRRDDPQPRTEAERELARALALLESDHTGSVTVAALRERGVRAPAQAVYDLQIAGYAIDRVTATDAGGRSTSGYRLRGPAPSEPDLIAGSQRADRDDGDAIGAGKLKRLSTHRMGTAHR
jgi:hypothetical protein